MVPWGVWRVTSEDASAMDQDDNLNIDFIELVIDS
jgi:hypothetical protein